MPTQLADSRIKLGQRVIDTATGFEGTVTGLADHYSGCRTAHVEAEMDDNHVPLDRLELADNHIMDDVDPVTDDLDGIELGQCVVDTITGFKGVVLQKSIFAYEAPKVYVRPAVTDDDGSYPSGQTLHASGVELVDDGVRETVEEMVATMTGEGSTGPIDRVGSLTE